MSPTTTYDFKNLAVLLDNAGIPVSVAAPIFKVSRTTIYSWCEGHAPNQELLLSNALRFIALIEKAHVAGGLPLPGYDKAEMAKGYDVEATVLQVRKVLKKFLN